MNIDTVKTVPPAANFKSVHYSYPDGSAGLSGVDLEIPAGSRMAVLGLNGAGKSTLLLHLNGLLMPDSGEVAIFGKKITPGIMPEIRSSVGLVFQNPDDQLFCLTVREDIEFGPANFGKTPAESAAMADSAASAVGLDLASLGHKHPSRLSMGEKKRAALATVLAAGARIVALDEPSSGLDAKSKKMVKSAIDSFSPDITVVIATHDIDFARSICTHAAIIAKGKVARNGSAGTILDDPKTLSELELI